MKNTKRVEPGKIPRRFFFYWSTPKGQKDSFSLVHYLSVLSLLETNKVESCEIYYENESKSKYWQKLKKLDKVKLRKLDFDVLFEKAGLERQDFKNFLEKSDFISQRSDLFRYLALYCYGGVYLDFDIMVLKDFEPLLNETAFVGIQHYVPPKSLVNNAVIGTVKGTPFMRACLDEFLAGIQGPGEFARTASAPLLISKVLLPKVPLTRPLLGLIHRLDQSCFAKNKHDISALVFLVNTCIKNREFDCRILPKSYFYSYSWKEGKNIFQENEVPEDAYLIHLWLYKSHRLIKRITEEYIKTDNSLYSSIAKQYVQ
ncbi:MAG: glycosyltransferase [archaeon]|jgi:hypothetical protein|nr:glycosyltransferase [archaeon]